MPPSQTSPSVSKSNTINEKISFLPSNPDLNADHRKIKAFGWKKNWYPVLKSLHNGLVNVEFNRDLRFAGTDVTVGIGRVQSTRYEKLFPGVWLLIQEDL